MIIPPDQLSIEQYHNGAPQWFSKTSLRYFQEMGPAWFKLWLDGQVKPKKPGGVEQGLALDCLLTEGRETLEKRFAFRPEGMDGRTKEGKEWAASNAGKCVLSAEDAMILEDAAAAVRSCCRWTEIEKCLPQMTVRRDGKGLGFGLQSRPDWLDLERGVMFDLKKTKDLNRFGGQAIDLGYHLQAAVAGWCLAGDGIMLERAELVAVEWERGARCRVYEIPQQVLAFADSEMRGIAIEISGRIKSGDWSDRQDSPEALDIPVWQARKMGIES